MASRLYRFVVLAGLALATLAGSLVRLLSGLSWPASLAIGLAIVIGCHALVLGFEFVLIRRLNRASPVQPDYPVYGGSHWLTTWLVELPAAWQVFLWEIPFFGHKPLASGHDPSRLPLVLVHGYSCNRAVWRPFARWMADRGHAIDAPNLEPLNVSLDTYSGQIHQAVEQLKTRTGVSQVGIVGHSMGGVAIRAYLREHGSASVAHIVTVGAPHHGTWLARLSGGEVARQLSLESAWLSDLANDESDDTGRLFTTIVGSDDNIIAPASIQTLPASRVVFFAGLGHIDLIFRKVVWLAIEKALLEPPAKRQPPPGELPD